MLWSAVAEAGEVVRAGYLMQGEMLNMPNFVNTQHQRLSCTFLKSVLCSVFKNMFISIIF